MAKVLSVEQADASKLAGFELTAATYLGLPPSELVSNA